MRASQLHSGDARAVSGTPPASTRELDADSGPVAVCDRTAPLIEVAPEPAAAVRSQRGRRRAAAPALVGRPAADAIAQLRLVGLTPAVELHETQLDGEQGVVLAQDPPPQADLARGATLALWVGAPPREAPAPTPDPRPLERPDRRASGDAPSRGADTASGTAKADVVVTEAVEDGWFLAEAGEPLRDARPREVVTDDPCSDTGGHAVALPLPVADEADEPEDDGWFGAHLLPVADDDSDANGDGDGDGDGEEPSPIESAGAEAPATHDLADAAGTGPQEVRWRRRLAAGAALLGVSVIAFAALAGARHPYPRVASRTAPAAHAAHPRRDARRTAHLAAVVSRRAAARRRAPAPAVRAPVATAPPPRAAAPASSAPTPSTERPSSPAAASAPAAQPAARAAESPARREFFAP